VLEATETDITCQITVSNSDYTGTTDFVGGLGAHVVEYTGIVNSQISSAYTPINRHFTDMTSRTGINSQRMTRTVEAWFVPPQSGDYIFHGSCDDWCTVYLSTTSGDKSAAAQILSVGWVGGWRNTWAPTSNNTSAAQTLVAGEKYYIKVIHDDYWSNNWMNIGFTIDDNTTAVENSDRGFNKIVIDPAHIFESFIIEIPENPDVSYKLKFGHNYTITNTTNTGLPLCTSLTAAGDIMNTCTTTLCPCTSTTFSSNSTESQFRDAIKDYFEKFHSYYGSTVTIVKEPIVSGATTTGQRFTATFRFALDGPSFIEASLFSKDTLGNTARLTVGTGYNFTFTAADQLTSPLRGKYRIKISDGSNIVYTNDLSTYSTIGLVMREIYRQIPTLLGKIEFRDSFDKFLQPDEGRELFWRTTKAADTFTFTAEDSLTDPLHIVNSPTHLVTITNNSTYHPASNKPVYSVIPGAFLKTVETQPQLTVSTNGLMGACPTKGACGFTFTPFVGDVTGYTPNVDFSVITVAGTSIPTSTIRYVSVGSCKCTLHPSYSPSATEVVCILSDCPAGDYSAYIQTDLGAVANTGSNLIAIPITISSVIPVGLYQSGGQTITITGANFPNTLVEANAFADFAVTFSDSSVCAVTSVTSTQILCTAPAGLTVGSMSLSITFNGKTQTQAGLTVTAPANTLSSIDKTSISAVQKQNLILTADAAPSTNVSEYYGLLVSPTKQIRMKINNIAANGTNFDFTARFPGAPGGEIFNVYLVYNGQRYASLVTLSTVTEISALTVVGSGALDVSTNGGDIISLTGTAFTTDINNLIIVVGNQKGTIISSTGTVVTARIPRTTLAPASATITLFQKPNIESTCSVVGGCTVNYVADAQTLTNPTTPLVNNNGVITVTGTGFGANAVGFVGDKQQTTISSTATQIELSLNNLVDPLVIDLEIRTDVANTPKVIVATPFAQKLISVTPNTGSIGGQKITLNTVGLGLETTTKLAITSASTNVCVEGTIKLVDSSKVTCITDSTYDFTSGAVLSLAFTHHNTLTGRTSTVSLSCATSSDCTFTTTAASTPTVTSATNAGNDLTVDVGGFTFDSSYTVTLIHGMAHAVATTISGTTATATFPEGFTPGNVSVKVMFELNGVTTISGSLSTSLTAFTPTAPASATPCSFSGGCTVEVIQNGLKSGAMSGDVKVTVCGTPATFDLERSTSSSLTILAPAYVNSYSQATYGILKSEVVSGTLLSESTTNPELAYDGITTTKVTGTGPVSVGYDFGAGNVAQLTKVRYFLGQMTDKQANCVNRIRFQSSTDGSTWTDVFVSDRYIRKGWNTNTFTTPQSSQFFRIQGDDLTNCPLTELEMIGNVVIDLTDTNKSCDIVVTTTGGSTQTFPAAVTYSDSATSKVSNISPKYGSYKGGETITLTGSGFSTVMAETSVKIDGIDCVVTLATSTSIECITGARPTVVSTPSTVVSFSGTSVNGYASMQGNDFTYANYWTDLETWGGEYAPQDGESIVIPKGQMLIVDIDNTPQLYAIIVQGSLVFIPHSDPNHHRTIDASYIFIDKGGVFECGTETARYTSKLTITMHGTRQDIQIPTYGNKGIFVRHALFDMHGAFRNTTWTELDTTLAIGGNTITTVGLVDWVVGEKIAIASTDFSLEHTEEFTITAIDNTGAKSIITLDRPAEHKHFAEAKNYTGSNGINPDKTKELIMRAEVGLLTRNILYKGADDDSVESQYGAHIMFHSPGDDTLTGRISYVELTQAGQAFQLGRYPIHFHMIGTVHGSYIKGNAIHHTYNRACTIHGVHYLTIEDNFAFQTMGHTYFIEDAVETNNNLHRNLAMKTMRSWSLLNTDQTPASFWITHPTNNFVDNHAAGSAKYGFWFDLQTHSTGPSTDTSICPQFEKLGEFTGNVAHSNGKYGLRIFHRFTPVEDPCAGLNSGAHLNREQPTGTGTTPQITYFRDFTSYKNNRTGLIAEEFGALKFQDIKVADNLFSGIEFGITAAGPWLTDSDTYQLEDALIVGASNNAELPLQKDVLGLLEHIGTDANEEYGGTRGLKGARTEKMRIKDTIFADFNVDANWSAIGTCSHCEGPGTDSSGRTYFFKNIFFINSDNRIKFDIPFKEIIYDQDGSIGNNTHRWIIFYFPHLDVPECARNENMYNGLLCSDTINIRRVVLHHGKPDNALKSLPLKVYNMRSIPANRRMMVADSCANSNSTSSFANMKTTDDNALDLQTQLLTQFNIKATNKTIYDEEVRLFDSTGLPSHNAAAVTAYNNMNAAQIEIDKLQPLVKAEYGKYDELWKYDTNFCNPDNYSVIEFRGKANPKKNWVFNAITGYEYHAHFGQGADFLTMQAEYSYAELLQGETNGIIIHLNHTERREAFNFSYTDSSLGTKAISPVQSTYVSLNSSSKMGDVYFNNVTRHIQIKMDGQNNDKLRFELLGDE